MYLYAFTIKLLFLKYFQNSIDINILRNVVYYQFMQFCTTIPICEIKFSDKSSFLPKSEVAKVASKESSSSDNNPFKWPREGLQDTNV